MRSLTLRALILLSSCINHAITPCTLIHLLEDVCI
jgi:hypothetical protein